MNDNISTTQDSVRSATITGAATAGKKSNTFTADERAAMRAHARELKAEAEKADG